MSEHRDPPRWLESGVLSEQVARDLLQYAGRAPAAASKARMLERLSTQIAELPAPVVEATSSAAMFKLKLLLGSAAVMLGAVSLWATQPAPIAQRLDAAFDEARAMEFRTAPIELDVAETVMPQLFEPEEVFELEETEPVRIVKRSVVRSIKPMVEVAAVAPEPVKQATQPDAIAELTMLARARRALINDPTRALALSEEHARSYPHGTFEEEREVLAIESLLKLGRAGDARSRALAFEGRFPRSPHIAHLGKMIAKPVD